MRAAPDPVADATVVGAIGDTLDLEPKVMEAVEAIGDRDRFVVVGSGSAEATAREAALKIREATGRFATAVGVEELLHGILPSVNGKTAVLAVSGTAFERRRALEGLTASRHLEAFPWLIDTSGAPTVEQGLALPPVPRQSPPSSRGSVPVARLLDRRFRRTQPGHHGPRRPQGARRPPEFRDLTGRRTTEGLVRALHETPDFGGSSCAGTRVLVRGRLFGQNIPSEPNFCPIFDSNFATQCASTQEP